MMVSPWWESLLVVLCVIGGLWALGSARWIKRHWYWLLSNSGGLVMVAAGLRLS